MNDNDALPKTNIVAEKVFAVVGKLLSFWEDVVSRAMLVFGSIIYHNIIYNINPHEPSTTHARKLSQTKFMFQSLFFRCHVRFREGMVKQTQYGVFKEGHAS